MRKHHMLGVLFVAGLLALAAGLTLTVLGYSDDAYSAPLMLGGLAVCFALERTP